MEGESGYKVHIHNSCVKEFETFTVKHINKSHISFHSTKVYRIQYKCQFM